jgi:hypothetical protein
MELVQSKSMLAKLMATENLVVEQRKVRTASFDVASRVLTLPILDNNISPELYDLFVGHEVGHALYTPEELLTQAHDLKLTHSVLNAIEDVRIERKIKSKYPGLKQPFVKGYKELIDKNFFGTKDTDLADLNFIDRANLHFKLGVNSGITFTHPIEVELIKEIEASDTVDDVLVVTKKVMEYLKEEKEESDTKTEESVTNTEESVAQNDTKDADDDEDEDGIFGEEQSAGEDDEIESLTDKAFQENQSQLFSEENSEFYYGNIPDIDLSRIVVPHNVVWDEHNEWCKDTWSLSYPDKIKEQNETFQQFRNDSKKVVAYLVKEFELKKNAEQLKKASVSKTGELDVNTIFSYKYNEDIFKKITVVPGGKSHGLIMFLDWSGSMRYSLNNTVKQLLNLVMFCKQINIPYDVYAFTSQYSHDYTQPSIEGDIEGFSGINMLNLLSNKMTTKQFNYAVTSLLYMSSSSWDVPRNLRLGSTPLNAAIVAAMKLVPKFKKDYKLQIVNTVFLTDGVSDNMNTIHYKENGYNRIGHGDRDYDMYSGNTSRKLIIRDPKTKHQETIKDIYDNRIGTTAYLKLLKSVTQCNVIGFFIINKREVQGELAKLFPNTINLDKIKSEFRANNYKIITEAGYDEYYLLRAEGLDTANEAELTIKENATTRGLVSSFTKFASKRTTNRVILNRFITMIS